MDILNYINEKSYWILTLIGQHFIIFIISTSIAVVLGVSIGIFTTDERWKWLGNVLQGVMGAAQSIPSIAVIALIFIFVGIGMTPAIIALVIYSLVPVIFNTTSGLLSVTPDMIEAAKGIGLTRRQILWKVKMPIATPVILAGIRSAATINIGTAVIASVIGGSGLGDLIFQGLKMDNSAALIIGAVSSALMAIIIDTILSFIESKITSEGLKINKS